jgi:EAL domain-containing protein (putative c-di-GMP-specific phosphodiesterase class I)
LPNPEAFIAAAERLGRLYELGRAIRAAAADAFRRAPSGAMLFLNLHAHDLEDDALYDPSEPLHAAADRVIFEITERASLDTLKDLPARIAALRQRGFRIAIDDLGAGYAGLTSFALLEPEFVKLDTSLVHDVHGSAVKQSIIGCITKLCHELAIKVVAEGVEAVEERDTLQALDCDLFQGYLFARPTDGFAETK